MKKLLQIIGPKIDRKQFGGTKNTGTAHYLIEFLTFILYNLDNPESTAVIATMIDFSKAFNRIDHNLIITRLADLQVPSWLLRVVMGFLENRKLKVKFKGATSDTKNMPGGGPQGTILGMFLFLILIDPIKFGLEEKIGQIVTSRSFQSMKTSHYKYMDDLTLAEKVDLKKDLSIDPKIAHPAPFHQRTGHQLIPSKCSTQAKVNEISDFAIENEMKVNKNKCSVMIFNRSKKFDFLPSIKLEN